MGPVYHCTVTLCWRDNPQIPFPYFKSVPIPQAHHSQVPHTGWLGTSLFFPVQEAGCPKPRRGCGRQPVSSSHASYLPPLRGPPSLSCPHGQLCASSPPRCPPAAAVGFTEYTAAVSVLMSLPAYAIALRMIPTFLGALE